MSAMFQNHIFLERLTKLTCDPSEKSASRSEQLCNECVNEPISAPLSTKLDVVETADVGNYWHNLPGNPPHIDLQSQYAKKPLCGFLNVMTSFYDLSQGIELKQLLLEHTVPA